jgi:hypothetical protein
MFSFFYHENRRGGLYGSFILTKSIYKKKVEYLHGGKGEKRRKRPVRPATLEKEVQKLSTH